MAFNFYIANLFAKLSADTSGFDKEMRRSAAHLRRSAEDMTQAGRMMSLGVTLPLIGIGAASAQMAMDFEESMTKIITLVGIAKEEVDEWGPAVKDMAGEVGVSAGELADALFYITSAGIRGANSMEVLEASAKASAIGMGVTKDVAYAAVSAMNAYGEANLSAEMAVATLIRTVRMGNMEAKSLPMAFGRVLPVAAELGISFQDVGASIAMMTRSGVTARLAAFALRSMMMTMVAPTYESNKAMHELGLTWAEVRRVAREDGLLNALQMIKEATGSNTEALQQVIPNARAFIGVLQLVGKNAEYTDYVFKHLAETTENDVNQTFEQWSEIARADMKKAWAEITEAAVTFGATLTPITEGLLLMAKTVNGLSKAYNAMPNSLKLITIGFAAAVGVIGPLLLLHGRLARAVAGLRGVMIQLIGTTEYLVSAQDRLTMSIKMQQLASTRLRMSWKGLRMEQTLGTAKIGTGIKNVTGMTAAMTGLGSAVGVVTAAWLGWDIGRWISDITGLTKATETMPSAVDLFTKSLANNKEEFDRVQALLVGVAAELGDQRLEWIMNAEQTDANAERLAKYYDEMMKAVHAKRLAADATANMTEAEKKHLSYMSEEQQHLRELIQIRDERNKKIREEYDLITGPEMRTAVRELQAEYENLKSQGIPIPLIWEKMKDKLKDAIRLQYSFGETASNAMRGIAAEIDKSGVPALQRFIDELDRGEQMLTESGESIGEKYGVLTSGEVQDALEELHGVFTKMRESHISDEQIVKQLGGRFKELVDIGDGYEEPFAKEIVKMGDYFAEKGEPAIKEMIDAFQNKLPQAVDVTGGKLLPMFEQIKDSVGGALEGGFGKGWEDGVRVISDDAYSQQLMRAVDAPLSGGFEKGFDTFREEMLGIAAEIRSTSMTMKVIPDYDAFWNALQDIVDGRVPDTGG